MVINLKQRYVKTRLEIIIGYGTEIKQRWVQYFQKRLNPKGALPIDLHIPDDPGEERTPIPTIEELNSAILALKLNKAPGVDGIPSELLKAGKIAVTSCMHQLIKKIWVEENLPHD